MFPSVMLMLTMTSIVLMSSIVFTQLTNPLSMGITIIILSAFISIILVFLLPSSWFSFLLLMVFLSGMMIVFIYVCSLASNDLFLYTLPVPVLLMTLLMMVTLTLEASSPFMTNVISENLINMNTVVVYKLFYSQLYQLTLILITYLLVVLIVVVKNTTMLESPLRSKK